MFNRQDFKKIARTRTYVESFNKIKVSEVDCKKKYFLHYKKCTFIVKSVKNIPVIRFQRN